MNMVAVVGMHRSGTSCLAGLLEETGVYFGDVSRSNAFNKKGNMESADIMRLNDSILMSNSSSWDAPPRDKINWSVEQADRLTRIICNYPGDVICGIKDPRILLTIDGWLRHAPKLEIIGTVRNPIDVATSLEHREEMPIDRGLQLWKIYNKKMLDLYKIKPFPIVNFNAKRQLYLTQVANALAYHGIKAPDIERFEFFDETLRHHQSNVEKIPEDIQEIYSAIIKITCEI